MKAFWRTGLLVGTLATAAVAAGCAGKGTRDLEEQNRVLQQALDDLQRRNAALEKENAALKGDDKIRDAYIKKLEQEAELARRIKELMAQQPIEGVTLRDGVFQLEGDFFFRSGSDDVSKEGVESLKKLAAIFKSQDVYVRIVGHTDNDPIKRSLKENPTGMNLQLGARRAVSVAHELQKAGVEETRMHVISMGQADPVASNDTKEGKKKNRRVDIMVSTTAPQWRAEGKKDAEPSK